MGKKKKTYVRPEMKIIEVKTEGVIAASSGGGEIEVPEDKVNGILHPQCVKDGSINSYTYIGECRYFRINYGNSCTTNWDNISPLAKTSYDVNIEYVRNNENNEKIFKITFNPTIKCN